MSTSESSGLTVQLNECFQCLQDIEKSYAAQTSFVAQFKRFIQHLSGCLTAIKVSGVISQNWLHKGRVQLCLSQVAKVLALFDSQPLCRQVMWYLCERLRWCISELSKVFGGSVTDCENASSFLQQISLALQLLHTHGTHVPPSWKQLVDELIYQAVTIAKIASPVDYQEITSACQKVLEESAELVSEVPFHGHPSQLSLLKDSLTANITSLEQRVNLAVLRLLLQVFAEPNKPLKQLVRRCGLPTQPHRLEDLDNLISELDSHIERIILIGQFAVSCCEDSKRVAAMKCYLASLESVDNYLVPALTAFYLSPDCDDKRQFVKFLCMHWQDQLAGLHLHLDAVIDSYAFSRIVHESISELSERLCDDEEVRYTVVRQGWLLYKHLSAQTTEDSPLETGCLSQFKQEVHKCETAVCQQAALPVVVKCVRRVIAVLENITDCLASSTISHNTNTDSAADAKSIRDLPLDISFISVTSSQYRSYNRPQWLQKKINDAKKVDEPECLEHTTAIKDIAPAAKISESSFKTPEIVKTGTVRNIFETPRTSLRKDTNLLTPYLSQTTERNTTLYVRTPRRMVQSQVTSDSTLSNAATADCQSFMLEITDILENLSMLADTLSSEVEVTSSKPTPLSNLMKQSSLDSQWLSLASVRTDQSVSDINTPDRLQDLHDLDEKILNLKLFNKEGN